jgi:hypothetical protein
LTAADSYEHLVDACEQALDDGLRRGAHLGDFVEKQRAARCLLEESGLDLCRPGECTPLEPDSSASSRCCAFFRNVTAEREPYFSN